MVDIRRETLTVPQVAKHFHVSEKTVHCWKRGVGGRKLDYFKIGGAVRITWEAIERFCVQVSDPQTYQPAQSALAANHAAAAKQLQEQFGR